MMVFGKLHRVPGAAASTWPGRITLGCIEDFCLKGEDTEKIRILLNYQSEIKWFTIIV
jgi:hypothetical protein